MSDLRGFPQAKLYNFYMDKLPAFLTHCLPLNKEFDEAGRFSVLVGFDHDDSNVAVLHKVCTAFCF